MKIDKNLIDFPTPRHRAIWSQGIQIIPLEISLTDIIDPEMRDGCTQIYQWTQGYIESMFENPDLFLGYDPMGMFRMLDDIAEHATSIDDGLIFTHNKYDHIVRARNNYIADLSLLGLEINDFGEHKMLINTQYPLFCKYFKLLYDGALKMRVNRLNYLLSNDFRVLAAKYKRKVDDFICLLPDNLIPYATELQDYVIARSAKLESHKYYSYFRFKYKKENVLILQRNHWRNTPLDIAVPYHLNHMDGFASFMQIAESQPDSEDLIAYILKEICKCDACAGSKNSSKRCQGWREIAGKRILLSQCHRDISKWKAPKTNLMYKDYDLKMLKRMIDIRIIQIDRYRE